MHKLGLALCFAFLGLAPAQAQPVTNPANGVAGAYNSVAPTCTNGVFCWLQVDSTGALRTTGSFSATISGFHEESVLAPITATTGGVSSSAFTAGKVVVATNAGTANVAYCQLGAAATTAGQPIASNGGWFAFTSTSETLVTCATSTSTTTVNFAVGTGLPTGTGGGGGGGGSSSITSWGGGTLGAMANYGTSPGAVLVPGQNAFITNIPAVSQSGTWTVQPGNTANTTPWLMSPSTGGNTAAVKAASTAPTATDPALVVSISPNSVNANGQATMANSAPVVVASNQSAIPVNGAVNVSPTTCSGTIATGGTAQNAITAGATLHGFTIANIDTSEVLWINFIGTAVASGTDSFPLAPATATTFAALSSYTTPVGAGYNTNLSVIAATTAHKFSCTKW